jgi:hypothetical protein
MAADELLVQVFVPALVAVLQQAEADKGEPLSEEEVIEIRDNAVCITVRHSQAQAMESKRGYPDLDPENIWAEWQAVRSELMPDGDDGSE